MGVKQSAKKRMAENAARRFAAMGLSPDDEEAKRAIVRRNYEFFGAPVVVCLCLGRALNNFFKAARQEYLTWRRK